jgi:hypothetical protein
MNSPGVVRLKSYERTVCSDSMNADDDSFGFMNKLAKIKM